MPPVPCQARAPPLDLAARVPDALHRFVGGGDLVAHREDAVELLPKLVHAGGRSGVVDHLEGLGERAVADPKAYLIGARQHQGSPVRLLSGLVAAQPHRSRVAQIPHETVDAGPHRRPTDPGRAPCPRRSAHRSRRASGGARARGRRRHREWRWRRRARTPRRPARRRRVPRPGGSRRWLRPALPLRCPGIGAAPVPLHPARRRTSPACRAPGCSPCPRCR